MTRVRAGRPFELTFPAAAVIILGYCIASGLIGILTGPSLALDDAKMNVLAQGFAAGYTADNPPLYVWLLYLAQRVVGPGAASFAIVKYGLYAVTALACRQTLRLVGASSLGASGAAIGLVLFYQYGWNYHQAFTHSLALIASVALFWLTLARLFAKADLFAFVFLGVAVGLGAISKYAFPLAAGVAVLTMLTTSDARARLIDARLLVAVAIAIVIAFGHFQWAFTDGRALNEALQSRFLTEEEPYWRRVASGAPQGVWAVVSFFLPAAILAPFLVGSRGASLISADGDGLMDTVWRRAARVGAGVLILAPIVFGLSDMPERYAVSFLYPAVLLLFARLDRLGRPAVLNALVASAALVLLLGGLRIAQGVVAGPPFCSKCRQFTPFEALVPPIRDAGWAAADLVAMNDATAGNLRRLFPGARVRSAHIPEFIPDLMGVSPCVFIWSPDLGPPPPAVVTDAFRMETVRDIAADWPRDRGRPDPRRTRWIIGEIDPVNPVKQSLCG